MAQVESQEASLPKITQAWLVHFLTATGAVLGLFALIAIAEGAFGRAVLLMLASLVVDSVDGTLARAAQVAQVTPLIDGRRLDDIVDYLNFAIVPTFFLWGADLVASEIWLAAPVLASAYGFSRVDAKTEDDFFLGFPSYWNILVFYLWLLDVSPMIGTLWVAVLSLAVFLPIKFLYPSKVEPMSLRVGLGVGAVAWTAMLVFCILEPESSQRDWALRASLLYPAWYLYLSLKRGGLHRAV